MLFNLISYTDRILYSIEYKIHFVLISELNQFKPSIFITLLICGLITALNPCLLSIIPITISYIYRQNNQELNKNVFISGLISSLLIAIIFTTLINQKFDKLIVSIPILSSIFTILIGLNLLNIIDFTKLFINDNNKHKQSSLMLNILNNNTLYNYLNGFIIGLNSIPCNYPILLTIIFWISNGKYYSISKASIYIFFYFSGYIIPIYTLIQLNINQFQLNILSPIWNIMNSLSGSFILSLGILSFLTNTFN